MQGRFGICAAAASLGRSAGGGRGDRDVANSIVSSATFRRAKQSCASTPTDGCSWAKAQAPASRRTADRAPLDPRVCASRSATSSSCGWLVLSSRVLAAERIPASDSPCPARGN